jgi:hypothetical protein
MPNGALPAGFVCLHDLVLVFVTRPLFSTSICQFATRVLGYLGSPRFCGTDTVVEWLYGLSHVGSLGNAKALPHASHE